MGRPRILTKTPDYRALFESAPGLYLVLDPDLTIVAASDAYLAATMTRREAILGRALFDVFPDNPADPKADGVANLRASIGRVLAQRHADTLAVQKYDIRRPDALGGGFEERYWSPVNWPILDASGEIAYIVHRVEDVTEFVCAQQRGSEQRLRARALEIRATRMETELFRRAQDLQEVNAQLRELQGEQERRVQARTADLQRANLELQREIIERKRAEDALRQSEDQLRQSQKLEAVGLLAGGIAHDFNNLLTVVLGGTDLLLAGLPPGAPERAQLEEIRAAGRRAAELTRQMLVFSRQQLLDATVLDLNEVLLEIHRMLVRILGEDIELRLLPSPEKQRIRADRGQIGQVVLNLVVNARDAMPEGGTLTIETMPVALDEEYATQHPGTQPGPYVMLAVSDTGTGMDKATQARAFDPFFTTKEQGKGTGLGLSTVLGIVQQSGGSIWLYSEPDLGSTFKIYLPRVVEPERDGDESASGPSGLASAIGRESVLLVEDEEQVRAITDRILRAAGYQVLVARGPGEALAIADRHPARIDLLLTDVVMPRMNGRVLAEKIGAKRPGIRVLFMSGYTDDVVLHHGVLHSGMAFIQKPLTPDALTRKVRQVLETPRGG